MDDECQRVITTLKNIKFNNNKLKIECDELSNELQMKRAQRNNMRMKLKEMRKNAVTDMTITRKNKNILKKINEKKEIHNDYSSKIFEIKTQCKSVVEEFISRKKHFKIIHSQKKQALNKIQQLSEVARQLTPKPDTLKLNSELTHKLLARKTKWKSDCDQLIEMISSLENERNIVYEKACSLQTDIDQRVGVLEEFETILNSKDRSINEYQTRIKIKEDDYQLYFDELNQIKSEVQKLTDKGNEIQEQIEKNERIKEEHDYNIKKINEEIYRMETGTELYQKSNQEKLQAMKNKCEEDISKQLSAFDPIHSQKDEEINKLSNELKEINDMNSKLQKQLKSAQENYEAEKKQIDASQHSLLHKYKTLQKMVEVMSNPLCSTQNI